MKLCPKCGAIVSGENDRCGICSADLWQTTKKPLEEAVQEGERVEGDAADQLMRKERASARRIVIIRLGVYVVTVVLILSGFLLLLNSTYAPLSFPFPPFWTGLVLVWLGVGMLLYVVIGAGPSERGLGWWRR